MEVPSLFTATPVVLGVANLKVEHSIDRTSRRIATGHEFSCAIEMSTSHVFCWGDNTAMQLTQSGHAQKDLPDGTPNPITSDGDGAYKTIVAGGSTACGIQFSDERDKKDRLYCWGNSRRGEAGTGDSDKNHFDEVRTLRPGD